MNISIRRAIAYVAGRAVSGLQASSLFDYSTGHYTSFSGSVSEQSVSVFDFDESCHISGTWRGQKLNLFHYGVGAHIDLKLEAGGKFSGFDYSTGSHFMGTVDGRNINLFDYGVAQYFNFLL